MGLNLTPKLWSSVENYCHSSREILCESAKRQGRFKLIINHPYHCSVVATAYAIAIIALPILWVLDRLYGLSCTLMDRFRSGSNSLQQAQEGQNPLETDGAESSRSTSNESFIDSEEDERIEKMLLNRDYVEVHSLREEWLEIYKEIDPSIIDDFDFMNQLVMEDMKVNIFLKEYKKYIAKRENLEETAVKMHRKLEKKIESTIDKYFKMIGFKEDENGEYSFLDQ